MASRQALIEAAQNAAGQGTARHATQDDAVDGVVPQIVVEPPDAEALAATLAWASDARLAVVTRGGGTKIGWGSTPRRVDVVLSTLRLRSVIAHRHGDLTATVEAGAPLEQVNRELATHRQWIPLDPPWAERATIGGIVSTNDSGPRRHHYGAPRDLIIGVGLARADGHLAKGGGIVVKNVAGYDLSRLLTGSFGSLAVIVSATFKLYPLPRASRTVVLDVRALEDLRALVAGLRGSPLTPTAIELATPPLRLLVRFETIEAAADQQASDAVALAAACGASSRIVHGAEEADIWKRHAARPWAEPGAVLKVSVLPEDMVPTLTWLQEVAGTASLEVAGRASLAVLLVRVEAGVDVQARLVTGLRERLSPRRGSAVVVRGAPALKSLVDVWGSTGDALGPMRAVKQQFDPGGMLNPGRGPGGL